MILECVVLFGVKHFEQCRTRIATKIGTKLIDFIEQDNWIDGAGLFHHLDDLTRQRTDISAAVTANFSFIAYATETETHKLAPGRARNRFTKAGFPHSGRAYKAR